MLVALQNNAPASSLAIETAQSFRIGISETILSMESEVAAIDAKIKELDMKRKNLEIQTRPLRLKLRGCDAVLSPIRRVPFDILAVIPRHAQPKYPQARRFEHPLSLCQVSSSWRNALLSTSDLWSTLYLTINDPEHLKRRFKRADHWFKRAKDRPLSLFIFFDFDLRPASIPALAAFLSQITPLMSRVRRLGLGSQIIHDLIPHMIDTKWDCRLLETLDFLNPYGAEYVNMTLPSDSLPALDIFVHASKLQRALLEKEFITTPGADRILPWSRLTSVTLTEHLSTIQWVRVMELCPRMQIGDFTLRSCEQSDVDLFGTYRRAHFDLKDLRLHVLHSRTSPIDVLSIFEMPCLQNLELTQTGGVNKRPIKPILKVFETLHSLVVDHNFDAQYLVDVLNTTVDLRVLVFTKLEDNYFSVFEAMTYNDSKNILPRLSLLRIHIGHVRVDERGADILAKMVNSRCPAGTQVGCDPMQVFISSYESHPLVKILENSLQPSLSNGAILDLHVEDRSLVCSPELFEGWSCFSV